MLYGEIKALWQKCLDLLKGINIYDRKRDTLQNWMMNYGHVVLHVNFPNKEFEGKDTFFTDMFDTGSVQN